MNKTFKKIFSVCCAVVTTLTATLFHSTNLRAGGQAQKIVVFAGPLQAGKTKLVESICGCSYNSNYAATISGNFASTSQLQIWDTGGSSKFLDVMNTYTRGGPLVCPFHLQ